MENKMKVFKSFSRFQDQKVGLMLALCFVVSMSYLALSKPFDQLTPKLQLNGDQTNLKAELGEDSRLKNVEEKENIKDGATRNSTTISPVSRDAHISQHLGVMDEEIKLKKGISTTLDSAHTNNTTLYSKEDVRMHYYQILQTIKTNIMLWSGLASEKTRKKAKERFADVGASTYEADSHEDDNDHEIGE